MRDYLAYTGERSDTENARTSRSYSTYRVIGKVYDSLPRPAILVTEGSDALYLLEVASIPLPI